MKRFMDKVNVSSDGCWVWQSAIHRKGYGEFWLNGRRRQAHRVGYELFVGTIPSGMTLDHLCRNRACVNPDHLEPVTNLENVRRGKAGEWLRQKTHCPHGHEYAGDNLKLVNGERRCRSCVNETARRYRERRAA